MHGNILCCVSGKGTSPYYLQLGKCAKARSGTELSNGWAIPGDENPDPAVVDERDGSMFYDLLEHEVVPQFYERDADGIPFHWCERVKEALVTCAPTFSATRMVNDYAERIYPAP